MRGIHVDFTTAGNADALGNLLAAADPDNGLNALQLDVKDEKGVIGIPLNVALAKRIGAVQPQYDARKVIKKAHEAGLYTIARIVVFQDPLLAAKGGKLALEKKGGGVWETSGGLAWVDPTDRRVWDYVIDVSLAAADAGFDEVMFDYVRFPTDGDVDAAAYARGNASKDKTIEGFLKKAGAALHAKRRQGVGGDLRDPGDRPGADRAGPGRAQARARHDLADGLPVALRRGQLRHPEPRRAAVRHGLRVAHRLAPATWSTARPGCARGCRTSTSAWTTRPRRCRTRSARRTTPAPTATCCGTRWPTTARASLVP